MLPLSNLLSPPITTGVTTRRTPVALLCLSQRWEAEEQHTVALAEQLSQQGRPVTLLVAANAPLNQHARARGISCAPLSDGPAGWSGQRLAGLVAWLRREGIQLLLTTCYADLGLAALLRVAVPSLRLVYRQQGPLEVRHGLGRWWQRGLLRLVDAWVAPLPWMAQHLRTQAGLDPRRLWVVAPALPVDDTFDCPSPREARCLLDLPGETPLIGVLEDGSTGPEFAVEALYRLAAEHGSTVELLVMHSLTTVPDLARWDRLRHLAQQLGVSQRVHLRPLHSSPASPLFYAAVNVLLVPEARSATAAPLLQSLARGCLVVSADSADAVDLLAPGQGSHCFPVHDLAACAGALQAVLQQTTQARPLHFETATRVQRRHSSGEESHQLEAILDYITPVNVLVNSCVGQRG
jgi:hypothetical protein